VAPTKLLLPRSFLWTAALLAALLPPAPSEAGSRCAVAKLRAAGSYTAGLAKCQAKATAKGAEISTLCVAKVQSKLLAAFGKAEGKGDCRTLGDLVPVQDVLDDPANEVFEILLPPAARRCCSHAGACFWAEDAAECEQPGVTIGELGSVCNGETRSCVPPPPVGVGLCCEEISIPALSAETCFGNPMLTCGVLGGVTVDDSVCHRSKRCLR
jgi:hypothetical protein